MPGPQAAPRVSGSTLHGKTTRSSGLPIEDIINDPDAEIKDTDSARKFLDQLYTVHGDPITPEHLSQALFYISQSKTVNSTTRSAIRTTAYLVRDLAALAIAESITKAVSSKLDASVLIAISPHIGKIMSTAEKLETANEQITTLSAEIAKNAGTHDTTAGDTSLELLEGKVQKLTDDVGSIKTAIEEVKDHLKTQTPPAPFPTPYRDALATYTANPNQIPLGKHPTQEHAKAHAAIRDRQILIDPDRDHPISNDSTKRETAIDLIKQASRSSKQG
ncbi:hypothetical protein F5J12DRAFT_914688 [Pisolithus orientalis]|uniref:uncharacterized protein n=1 Tax=Pisolithus orientalis TaxID=936130 RepID=UPI0022252A14|nr:uncharacterized protein F5J12DRAFT_914688 [Pisolithus orientalis]KAI5998393.1 hypothetical protein F5J12DRAFT_914688 [Pisolithus orientalis]